MGGMNLGLGALVVFAFAKWKWLFDSTLPYTLYLNKGSKFNRVHFTGKLFCRLCDYYKIWKITTSIRLKWVGVVSSKMS